jgi:cation transport ATPase
VLLAALGFINPLGAALIHVTSELFFICNSARLLLGNRSWSSALGRVMARWCFDS